MNIPHDEQAHYDAARAEALAADEPERPKLSDDQRRYLQLVARQAARTIRDAPDLLHHLERMSHTVLPSAASSAAEVALFRQGIAHAVFTIHNASNWPGDDDG